jgi:hypothetical protein
MTVVLILIACWIALFVLVLALARAAAMGDQALEAHASRLADAERRPRARRFRRRRSDERRSATDREAVEISQDGR